MVINAFLFADALNFEAVDFNEHFIRHLQQGVPADFNQKENIALQYSTVNWKRKERILVA